MGMTFCGATSGTKEDSEGGLLRFGEGWVEAPAVKELSAVLPVGDNGFDPTLFIEPFLM